MDKFKGTRIRLEDLTAEEVAEMKIFGEKDKSVPIEPGIKHQVVYRGGDIMGIAISRNGRTGFRVYDLRATYTLYCSTTAGINFSSN